MGTINILTAATSRMIAGDGLEPSLDARNSAAATATSKRAESVLLTSSGSIAAANISGLFAARAAAARQADLAAHAAATGPVKRAAAAMAAARAPLPSRLMDMVPDRHRSHPFFLLDMSFPRVPGSLAQVSQLSHEVFPRVYLGSVAAAEPEQLAALKITHVVNALGAHAERCRPKVKYWSAPMIDMPSFPLHRFLKPAAAWIAAALAEDPNNRVLVHCLAGVSRSASLLLAHAMSAHGLRISEAYIRVQTARPQAEPNPGFRAALIALDEHLFEGAPWPHEEEELPPSMVVDPIPRSLPLPLAPAADASAAAATSAASPSASMPSAVGGLPDKTAAADAAQETASAAAPASSVVIGGAGAGEV